MRGEHRRLWTARPVSAGPARGVGRRLPTPGSGRQEAGDEIGRQRNRRWWYQGVPCKQRQLAAARTRCSLAPSHPAKKGHPQVA